MTDILGTVNDFLLAFVKNGEAVPALEQDQIIRGWQNFGGLAGSTQELAVLTLRNGERRGTNVKTSSVGSDGNDVMTISKMSLESVQVDFCCAHPAKAAELARARADILTMLFRDSFGVDFFRCRGLGACYADNPMPLPYSNESKQWVARYMVTLHLSVWIAASFPMEHFSAVSLNIENVDVHHPAIFQEN